MSPTRRPGNRDGDAAGAGRTSPTPPQEELTVPSEAPSPVLFIVMGPASCGKSTIGTDLAASLHLPFIDGDTLHPQSNIDKMSHGIPLNDDDRLPWLALIRSTAERVCKEEYEKQQQQQESSQGGAEGDSGERGEGIGRPGVVIACSALKKWYRDILRGQVEANPPPADDLPRSHPRATESSKVHHAATSNLQTLFVYCQGTPELLHSRIAARKGHFMGAAMLTSQLATLEEPIGEDGVSCVDIDGSREVVAQRAADGAKNLLGLKR